MASKSKPTPQKEEVAEKEDPEAPPDSPLLDLPGAAIRKMIKQAKKRGYVTYKQLNSVLPSGEVASEQIENTLAALNEMGIDVVEPEEAETEGEEQGGEPEFEESEGSEIRSTGLTPDTLDRADS